MGEGMIWFTCIIYTPARPSGKLATMTTVIKALVVGPLKKKTVWDFPYSREKQLLVLTVYGIKLCAYVTDWASGTTESHPAVARRLHTATPVNRRYCRFVLIISKGRDCMFRPFFIIYFLFPSFRTTLSYFPSSHPTIHDHDSICMILSPVFIKI